MKKLTALVGLVACAAYATSYIDQNTQVKQETAYTVATNIAGQVTLLNAAGVAAGVDLELGGGVSMVLAAASSQTITGGNMRCYVYLPVAEAGNLTKPNVTYAWLPYPALDFAPATGNRYAASGDKQSFSGTGRIVWLPDAITVSGGTTVTEVLVSRKGLPVGRGAH